MINLGTGTINDFPQGETRIGKMYLGDSLVYQYVPPPPPNYFYSEAIEDGTFTLTIASSVTPANLEYVSYSVDGGETWVKTDNVSGEVVTITTPTISAGGKVLWKGKAKTYASSFSAGTYSVFTGSALHNIGGNIGYLFYSDDYNGTQTTFEGTNSLQHFFYQDTNLVNAEDLILFATTSKDRCYQSLFEGCSNLETPPSILATNLNGYYCCYSMFGNCSKLQYAPTISATVASAGALYYMFSGCALMQSADLSSITSVIQLQYTFNGCSSLSNVAVPPNITTIGNNAFYNCASLTNLNFLPSGITSISQYAFYGCSGITGVIRLNAVTSIGQYSFYNCSKIEEVYLPEWNQYMSTTDVGWRYCFSKCTSMTTFYAPKLRTVTYNNFDGCSSLENVTLTACEKAFNFNFQNCTSLKHIELPAITVIGSSTFRYDSALLTADLGENFTKFTGSYCFADCPSMQYIVIRATTPPTSSNNNFGGSNNCTIYVPYSSDHSILSAYQQYYSTYASRFAELNPDGTIPE